MIIKEPLMNLRTQEKLSYVSCNLRDINGMLGYSITVCTVQTDKCTTEFVDLLIERFLNSFKIILEQFSEKELDDIKEGLRILKQHDAEILKNEVNRNWSEITKRQFIFDRCEKEAFALENLNINKLREWFGRLNGNNLRKLSIHVVGTDLKEIAVSKQIFFLIEF